MELEALLGAEFTSLGNAVADWRQMRNKLETLAADARSQLRGRAEKADWAGVNSEVTRSFIRKTVGEIEDAHTQAESIYSILKDTCAELAHYRDSLEFKVAEADWCHIRVKATGGGSFEVSAKDGAQVPQPTLDRFRDDVAALLKRATESDSSAKEALCALVDQSKYGFSDARYRDRDEAAKALDDAERAAALAEDPAKAAELNRLLKRHRGDSLFAERFATELGPEGTLAYWLAVNDPGRLQPADLGELQKNLSTTLALATHSDSAAMDRWERALIAAGPGAVGKEPGGPVGFQVMSNLMRYGDYDDSFLTEYGAQLVAEDRRRSDGGEDPGWDTDGSYGLNPNGPDGGLDPMTGYLKGLARNPEAATDFLTEGPSGKTNFHYLFNDRVWPKEYDVGGEELPTGKNHLAQAIAAGATGTPVGEPIPRDLPPHNERQVKLFEDVVHTIAKDGGKLTDNGYMSDSLGKMTAHYLPDINRAISDDTYGDTPKLYPLTGAQASPSHLDITRFLVSLGQNPEGYATVELGQKQYAANLMDYHLNPDLPEGERYIETSESPESAIRRIAEQSGEVAATLAIGRQEAVLGPANQKDEDFIQSMAQGKNLASGAIGVGIGVGTSFVASPLAAAVSAEAASTASSMVLEEVFQANEAKNQEGSAYAAGEKWQDSRNTNIALHQKAAFLAAKAQDSPYRGDVADWAQEGTNKGFSNAGTNAEKMAGDLETDI
ncbi:DUF6571 family protein [Streptomyces sp. 891-h]|uniref:DUF6571 family protein n=1 Tax=Streptomyces sp. 891-h TaxID=2720714 RepID=UPI001FAA47A3|nr:DUF6571 family protein [Streptomyces sp. 891-h]UNZ19852.1 hypothetical protein HC362_25235 [Streptomyces sp. 891-h]